jgi:glycosyltransferase involved in cell wall biosynthesis
VSAYDRALKVSCVIAVYNGEAYLREAVDSVLSQAYPDIELIIVDDGSTDGTAAVIAEYGDRVRAFRQENRGVSVARNLGVAATTGELLSFLDADDRLDPRKVAMQIAAFRSDPDLEFCDCHTAYFWSEELTQDARERDFRHSGKFWQDALPGHISGWLFRRELWARVGEFRAAMRYSEDTDWLSRARDLPMRQRTLADVLTHRRLHAGNVTARHGAEQRAALAQMLHAHRKRARLRQGGPPNSTHGKRP